MGSITPRPKLRHLTQLDVPELEDSPAAISAKQTAESAHALAVTASNVANAANVAVSSVAADASSAVAKATTAQSLATALNNRMDARTILALSANGTVMWTFPTPFPTRPNMKYMVYDLSGDNHAVILQVESWVMDAGNYKGVNMKAYRLQNLPTITSLLVGLLSLFNVGAGSNFNNVSVSLGASVNL